MGNIGELRGTSNGCESASPRSLQRMLCCELRRYDSLQGMVQPPETSKCSPIGLRVAVPVVHLFARREAPGVYIKEITIWGRCEILWETRYAIPTSIST